MRRMGFRTKASKGRGQAAGTDIAGRVARFAQTAIIGGGSDVRSGPCTALNESGLSKGRSVHDNADGTEHAQQRVRIFDGLEKLFFKIMRKIGRVRFSSRRENEERSPGPDSRWR